MKKINVNLADVLDKESFHNVFALAFSFPNYYGKNMDAWIDSVDDYCSEYKMVVLELKNSEILKKTNRKILNDLLECSAFVNYRRLKRGDNPSLIISMN
ncbi:barnase inhibitor [Tenacibaculum aiptasiae]|uniref:Barnase inhibitor n=1 Tax=Tenacibaculum aiptasiae TaxID=426481 RepID=A0A7J5AD01_9FLAO|nr:barstar family protein [Tenacibaculum aiptasiae]KAB1155363.1 barnase inhibitor [Tenacibaculum aiptasiae]